MSISKSALLLAAAVMLLPMEESKQTQLATAASQTAERSATFCERNPSTCAAGRDLWAVFLRKAEFGMELGARLVREQMQRGSSEPAVMQSPVPARVQAAVPAAVRVNVQASTAGMAPAGGVAPQQNSRPPLQSRATFTMEDLLRLR